MGGDSNKSGSLNCKVELFPHHILAGSTNSYGVASYNVWLIKTDSNGNELWNNTFGGHGNSDTSFVQQTLEGGYIIAGSTNSYGAGLYYPWLTKTDANGNELWNRTINGTRDA